MKSRAGFLSSTVRHLIQPSAAIPCGDLLLADGSVSKEIFFLSGVWSPEFGGVEGSVQGGSQELKGLGVQECLFDYSFTCWGGLTVTSFCRIQ